MGRRWQGLVPGLAIGFGIVASTLAAKRPVLAGPIALATAILLADALAAGERRRPRRPSTGAWILAAATLIASGILGRSDPRAVAESMSLLGAAAWIVLLLPNSRPQRCLPPPS